MSKKPKYDFGFKNPEKVANLFAITDPENINYYEIKDIRIGKLTHFQNHPFKLYEGERFIDMIESIKENGIIMPIIVRPLDGETYEILSGHNRVEASRVAGLETVPAIIRENLSDAEAMLIVTETNLIQRSFSDLTHSERAAALAVRHEAIKSQGKRTDLINEIEILFKNDTNVTNNEDNQTFSQLGKKLNNVEKLGEDYGLSKNSVARYLRINKLINTLKIRLDNKEFGIIPAVEISYMSEQNQFDLAELLSANPEFKIDIKKSELLREFSEDKKLNPQNIYSILSGQFVEVKNKKRNRSSLPVQSIKIGGKILSKYFKPEQKPEEIEAEFIEALEFYRANRKEN